MEKGWEKIFSSAQPYQAEVAKQVLEENGITAVVINKKDSSYLAFGEAELYVKQDDVIRAKQLIKSLEH
jgi:Zn-dependent membrane protease YugP